MIVTTWPYPWTLGVLPSSWDYGIRWRVDQVEAPTDLPLTAEFVRDQHLRSPNGVADLEYIEHLIRVATLRGERFTRRAFMPQTLRQVLSGFPSGAIELAMPPLIEVTSVAYIDEAGDEQTVDTDEYAVTAPSGPMARRGTVAFVSGGSWPSTDSNVEGAVTITYRAGYETGSPAEPDVPDDLKHGILLTIGELYKVRSDSVSGASAGVLRARDLWMPYRIFP